MPDYYFQIKGRSEHNGWHWPPLHSGQITAPDKKAARKLLEEEYELKMKMGGSGGEQFFLSLDDMSTNHYLQERFKEQTCQQCGATYTHNSKYLVNAGGAREFCSVECNNIFKQAQAIGYGDNRSDFNGIHPAVIYKITCRIDNKCYIGKTTQAFTLRWYQHFYQGSGTKFHEAIKQFGINAWTFEVIEVINIPQGVYGREKDRLILERETYWIKQHDSIENGYNTVISLNEQQP